MFKILSGLIMFIALLLGIYSFGYLMGNGTLDTYFTGSEESPKTVNDIPIFYGEEMSEEERITFKVIVDELNPLYLEYIESITIGKNKTKLGLHNKQCTDNFGSLGCGGKTLNGDVIVGWTNVNSMKITLCHEILHDFIGTKSNKATLVLGEWIHKDAKHAAIEHMGKKKVCFG